MHKVYLTLETSWSKRFTLLTMPLAYLALLSYAVWQLLRSDLSPRLHQALLAGWVAGLLILLGFLAWTSLAGPKSMLQRLERLQEVAQGQPRWLKSVFYLALVFAPTLLLFTGADRGLLGNYWFRWAFMIPVFLIAALIFPLSRPKVYWQQLSVTILCTAIFMMSVDYLAQVSSYPFSLGWSEGNRFYDYSLIFGKSLYQYDGVLKIPYFSPGRYALWGLPFLIPNLPIAAHRLWNALLWVLPPLLFGWVVVRRVSPWGLKLGFALWSVLFINQGPIYAPLLLSAILILLVRSRSLWPRGLAAASASLYAGLSRWTWFSAPGAWAVLLLLCAPPADTRQPFKQRFGAATLLALLGSLPGLLANYSRWIAPKAKTLSLSQPLLWYRLLPNPSYPNGLLIGLAIASLPVAALLLWLILSRRWKLDWLQALAVTGGAAGYMLAGLIASTKIGGGNNLHNLDMFLATLAITVMIYLESQPMKAASWPVLAKVALVLAVFLPTWYVFRANPPGERPSQVAVDEALEKINLQVDTAQKKGEVLFLDQRQLLTFGDVRGVPLVPEYEKKYVMDQAMAGNQAYFSQFYQDLANQRFSLIVSEPLFTNLQSAESGLPEENNAWVKWVSKPLLCYYTPKSTIKSVKVQLLIPREDPKNCPG